MLDLSLAIAHHLAIFLVLGVIVAELMLVQPGLDRAALARLVRIDAAYGVLAVVILAVGSGRAAFAAKGWDYYQYNLFFWAKLGTFLVIGLLSVPPTLLYLRWRRAGQPPDPHALARVRRYLWTELALFALLPAFAAAMARGYGAIGL